MIDRRRFIQFGSMFLPVGALAMNARASTATFQYDVGHEMFAELQAHDGAPEDVARDEDFWFEISRAFTVDRSLVNLNNGGVSPSPRWVQEAMKRHLDYSNTAPPYTMWQILEPQRETVRDRLARHWDVSPEEIAITRNASEGLQICQFGIDLKAGDEVLTTTQDYGRMLTTFRQRMAREKITMNLISIPVPSEDDDDIVRRFEEAITPRTCLILCCHVINLTGQILPVDRIAAMARKHDVPVIIDGAHAFAHLDFKLSDLNCDYYATSLHKWLFAPHGTGLLYVRRERIGDLWPLMAANESQRDDIRKFEEIGTHPAANALAIAEALNFHQGIGNDRKFARLIYLRDYWARRLSAHRNIRLNTSLATGFAGGLANAQVIGVDTAVVNEWLWDEHRILTVGIKHDEFEGLRITPSVYTTIEELDRLCDALEQVADNGLPGAATP